MPNMNRDGSDLKDELQIATRIMDTVERQISDYRLCLEKVRLLRDEIQLNDALYKQMSEGPDAMTKVLISRGVSQPIAKAMAAEDFQTDTGGDLGLWTWNCCCTQCCITCINDTKVNQPKIASRNSRRI